jgi:hypothetical protein
VGAPNSELKETRISLRSTRAALFVARRAIPVETVARATVRAIHRNQLRVRLSVDYALIDWITRLAPSLAVKLFARVPLPF